MTYNIKYFEQYLYGTLMLNSESKLLVKLF